MSIMASIDQIRASDGSGNANVATVQNSRSSGSSTIVVDTVAGINDTFMASMGTPHTFTDPITSETITVISEATCVDFSGHVDGVNLEIDDIAPGQTDLGSEVGDIIIIRPTTQWADNVADVLGAEHNDDGTLKTNSVIAANITNDNVTADKIDWAATGADGGIWWEELGRTTLGGNADSITVSGLPARRHLMLLIDIRVSGDVRALITFNGDTGNNYASATYEQGADTTEINQAAISVRSNGSGNIKAVVNISSLSSAHEKLVFSNGVGVVTAGPGTAPVLKIVAGKWANTANEISSVTITNNSTGDYQSVSSVIVLGHNQVTTMAYFNLYVNVMTEWCRHGF